MADPKIEIYEAWLAAQTAPRHLRSAAYQRRNDLMAAFLDKNGFASKYNVQQAFIAMEEPYFEWKRGPRESPTSMPWKA